MRYILTFIIGLVGIGVHAQTGSIAGQVLSGNKPLESATVTVRGKNIGAVTDSTGAFILANVPVGRQTIDVSLIGYNRTAVGTDVKAGRNTLADIALLPTDNSLHEVVVSGTMKEVSRLESPVPVEVFSARFFKANPTPSIFDALQTVNGVRPQVNCNVCNTGDIHINGLEGPYTMVLIDGMPIVSGLSTVYGLSGIPQALIDRMEVVKGPASTLYGSEAVGGLINIITKTPQKAPVFSADAFATTWGEVSTDLAGKFSVGEKTRSLLGVNYFNFQNPVDKNKDNFTDLTLQNRISVFNKWDFQQKGGRALSLAARYMYEDRWGGEMNWNRSYRGGDQVYGESIYTKRWEAFGNYRLSSKLNFMFSANWHDQNSVYGHTPYLANQNIYFGQLTWGHRVKAHDLLAGLAYRYTYYDDNTPATFVNGRNRPNHTYLPGVFLQDEIRLNTNHTVMLGARYDYNSVHGSIFSPRVNYKWSSDDRTTVFRLGGGNGFRVANVFTEDHAALTGARQVVFLEDLKPETSWNVNANLVKKFYLKSGTFLNFDGTAFYTYFTNKIIPDYDTDPNRIIYANLDGYAVSRGVSLNADLAFASGLKFLLGGTLLDVYNTEAGGKKERQMFAERFTGTWSIGYTFPKPKISIDYTGNVYGPMRLPLLGPTDPRPEYSPVWSIQNIQVVKTFNDRWEIYGGVKNLLNWTPAKSVPFLIARPQDPFDKQVVFDANNTPVVNENNPYGLTFDPSYVYASNQGIRGFLGVRFTVK
ncbi:MAG: TonB-dependent receptor [Leadbetterella sp.]|nr:TonB-dependent receptor [Leadbetterella sp.]